MAMTSPRLVLRLIAVVALGFTSQSSLQAGDCNRNSIEDDIDIASGSSSDCNGNGVPDECDTRPTEVGFHAAKQAQVGVLPHSLRVADLDGDGALDLAVADLGANDESDGGVSVVLNRGNGAFAPAREYRAPGHPNAITSGDLDGDGDIDLVTVNQTFSSGTLGVLFNDGDGTFQEPVSQALQAPVHELGEESFSITCADLDGDGDLDVAVANGASDNVSVLLNEGDGAFAAEVTYHVGDNPSSISHGDLDGDGRIDLVVTTREELNNITVLLNHGDGVFPVRTSYSSGGGIRVAVGELNGDGAPDLAIAKDGAQETQLGAVSVLLNNGDGTLGQAVDHAVIGRPRSVIASDLDGDGDTDLATADEDLHNVSVLLNNRDGTFRAASGYSSGAGPFAIASGDFDGDGNFDLATANRLFQSVSVLFGNGDGTFQAPANLAGGGSGIAAADFNDDGIADLATCNLGMVSVRLNSGNAAFLDMATYRTKGNTETITAADVDGDGNMDLATASPAGGTGGTVSLLLNRGDGSFQQGPTYPDTNWPVCIAAADLDGDGDQDLATASMGSRSGEGGAVSVLINDGEGRFWPGGDYEAGHSPRALAVSDLDGDGDLDVAVANGSIADDDHADISVIFNNGDGTFERPVGYFTGGGPSAITCADLDRDGDKDVAACTIEGVLVLLNDGLGALAPPVAHPVPGFPRCIGGTDLDGDGDVDLVTASPSRTGGDRGRLSVLVNNGDATFEPALDYPQGGQSLALADLDNDEDRDVVTANALFDSGSTVSVLLNRVTLPASEDRDDNGIPDECERGFQRGDADASATFNITDGIFILNFLFLGGREPPCLDSADTDDSGAIDLADGIRLFNFFFMGGPPPSDPFRSCGVDVTADDLTCRSFEPCQ